MSKETRIRSTIKMKGEVIIKTSDITVGTYNTFTKKIQKIETFLNEKISKEIEKNFGISLKFYL